jgi:hypothetical protein
LPVITVPITKIVIVPRVVVRVEPPLVIVETTTEVIAEEDVVVGTVIVEAYERYDPVGVVSVAPVRVMIL